MASSPEQDCHLTNTTKRARDTPKDEEGPIRKAPKLQHDMTMPSPIIGGPNFRRLDHEQEFVTTQTMISQVDESPARPRGFLDLPGEIRNTVYEYLAKAGHLEIFSTSKFVRHEGVAIVSKYRTFVACAELESWNAQLPASGTATAFIQRLCLNVDMNPNLWVKGSIWSIPRFAEYFGGSHTRRVSCEVILTYSAFQTTSLSEHHILETLGSLTGFRNLVIRLPYLEPADSAQTFEEIRRNWSLRLDLEYILSRTTLDSAMCVSSLWLSIQ